MPAGERLAPLLAAHPDHDRLLLACSGGLDSQVLLHRLANDPELTAGRELRAVHVHHGLHARADDWAMFCERCCATLGVVLQVRHVDARPQSGESPEAAARRARYAALRADMDSRTALLTAHHRADQAETVLLALLRGAGPRGLAAMPAARIFPPGVLLRPLLDCGRASLRDYAERHNLDWIDDPANVDPAFDRNYLRGDVLPLLRARWPAVERCLARSARHCAEASALLEQLAAQDRGRVGNADDTLSVERLRGLDPARQRNLLRYWLHRRGLPTPDERQLQAVLDELLTAGRDRQPCVHWPGGELRRYRDRLYAMVPIPAPPTADAVLDWDGRAPLVLPDGGCLVLRSTPTRELPEPLCGPFTVRFRRGGERFHPAGRFHGQTLKKLLQDTGIPPWWRERLPLLYRAERLIAVPGLGVAVDLAAIAARVGWCLEWQNPAASVTLFSRLDAGHCGPRPVYAAFD